MSWHSFTPAGTALSGWKAMAIEKAKVGVVD
jgi:hypothetical protein